MTELDAGMRSSLLNEMVLPRNKQRDVRDAHVERDWPRSLSAISATTTSPPSTSAAPAPAPRNVVCIRL